MAIVKGLQPGMLSKKLKSYGKSTRQRKTKSEDLVPVKGKNGNSFQNWTRSYPLNQMLNR